MGAKPRAKYPLNEELLTLVRHTIGPRQDIFEKRMFGGVAFLLDGKMTCGVVGDDLMIRVAPEDFEASLGEPHTRPMDFTGRPLRGFLYLARTGWDDDAIRKRWIQGGVDYAAGLPAPKPRKPRPRKPRPRKPRPRKPRPRKPRPRKPQPRKPQPRVRRT